MLKERKTPAGAGEYITNEEATMLQTIKAVKKITFQAMAEELGMTNNYLSKIIHGKRRIPTRCRESFDDFIEKNRCELILSEVHTKQDIPDRIYIQNEEGEIRELSIPAAVLNTHQYRRSSEVDRENVLKTFGVIPEGFSLLGMSYEETNFISAEDYSRVQILMSQGILESRQIANLLGVHPQYFSNVLHRRNGMSLTLNKKLKELLESYGV